MLSTHLFKNLRVYEKPEGERDLYWKLCYKDKYMKLAAFHFRLNIKVLAKLFKYIWM